MSRPSEDCRPREAALAHSHEAAQEQQTRGPVSLGMTGSLAGEALAFGVEGFRFLGEGDASFAVTGLLARLRPDRVTGDEVMLYSKREIQDRMIAV